MSAVCASPLLGSLVDLDVLDDQVAGVETFGVGVGFGVFEQTEEELGGLFGPARFGDAELFACEIEGDISNVLFCDVMTSSFSMISMCMAFSLPR